MMPHMSGREVATQLAQWHPESKVLFMSGYTDHAIVHDGGILDSGTAFLQKPFTADALLRKIREVLGPQAARTTAAGADDRSSDRASAG